MAKLFIGQKIRKEEIFTLREQINEPHILPPFLEKIKPRASCWETSCVEFCYIINDVEKTSVECLFIKYFPSQKSQSAYLSLLFVQGLVLYQRINLLVFYWQYMMCIDCRL